LATADGGSHRTLKDRVGNAFNDIVNGKDRDKPGHFGYTEAPAEFP
jgi:hypothetical protein